MRSIQKKPISYQHIKAHNGSLDSLRRMAAELRPYCQTANTQYMEVDKLPSVEYSCVRAVPIGALGPHETFAISAGQEVVLVFDPEEKYVQIHLFTKDKFNTIFDV